MESLRQMGYTLLSMPSSEIRPLLLLAKTSRGEVINLHAAADELFLPNNVAMPPVSADVSLPASISSNEILDLKVDSNFSLVKGLIQLFSSGAKADFSLEKTKTVAFKLNEPKKNFISILKLDSFIQDATLNTAAKSILERLKSDDLYIITETVKTKSFSIEDASNTNINTGVTVPAGHIAEAGGSMDYTKDKKGMTEYSGDEYEVIAVKAYQILYNRPSLFSNKPPEFRIRAAENIKVMRGEEEYPANRLADEVIDLTE